MGAKPTAANQEDAELIAREDVIIGLVLGKMIGTPIDLAKTLTAPVSTPSGGGVASETQNFTMTIEAGHWETAQEGAITTGFHIVNTA